MGHNLTKVGLCTDISSPPVTVACSRPQFLVIITRRPTSERTLKIALNLWGMGLPLSCVDVKFIGLPDNHVFMYQIPDQFFSR